MINKDYLGLIRRRTSYLTIAIISGVLLVIFTYTLTFLYSTIHVSYVNPQNNYFNDSLVMIVINYTWIILCAAVLIVSIIFYIKVLKESGAHPSKNEKNTKKCTSMVKLASVLRIIAYFISIGSIVPLVVSLMYFVTDSSSMFNNPSDHITPALFSLLAFILIIAVSALIFIIVFLLEKKTRKMIEKMENSGTSDEDIAVE